MSLDNIQLPRFIIQDLFQKSLVDLSIEKPMKSKPQKGSLNFFGGNNKYITILINDPGAGFIAAEQQTFLSGILNACKLTMDDIALINMAAYPTLQYQTLSQELSPKIILLFGVPTAAIELPFVIPEFQKQLHNKQLYLSAPSLSALESDKELKRKLWVLLKEIFSL